MTVRPVNRQEIAYFADAIRLYQKYGFHKTEQQPNTTWSLDGESVMEEKFELAL